MHPRFAIEREGGGSEDRRQLARGSPAGEIDLEEAVLAVYEAGGHRQIAPGVRGDGGDAEIVPLDADGRRQTRDAPRAVE